MSLSTESILSYYTDFALFSSDNGLYNLYFWSFNIISAFLIYHETQLYENLKSTLTKTFYENNSYFYKLKTTI